jgi:zinc protease
VAAIGYGIVNRRLQHMARRLDAPFRAARYSTTDIFRAGRETAINIDAVDGHWRQAMLAAVTEVRRTLAQGVIPAEIAEQVAVLSAAVDTAASRDDTISSGTLAQAALNLLRQRRIPATPDQEQAWLHAQVRTITPAMVLAALKADAEPLDRPLIRFVGRRAPAGGEETLRAAWAEAASAASHRAGYAARPLRLH